MALARLAHHDEDTFFGLEGERLEAALTVDRNLLVLAGPGAGKTHLLVAHAVHLASTQKGRVIQLTFSRNAANELERRVQGHLSPYASRRVITGTIHSYALKLLQSYGWRLELGRPLNILESRKDIQSFAQEVATQRQERIADDFAERLEQKLRLQVLKEEERASTTLMGAVIDQMRITGNLTWGLTLDFAHTLLTRDSAILSSLRHHDPFVLLDEAQDCDPLQLSFVEALVGKGPGGNHLFVAMDPDQSLYAFRDADPERALAWAEGFQPVRYELSENFRCEPRIVALSRYVLGKGEEAVGEGGSATLMIGRDKRGEAGYVAEEVRARLERGELPERIAVLGRHNYVIQPVIEALRDRGISVRVRKSVDFDLVEEKILAALALLHQWDNREPWAEQGFRTLRTVFGISKLDGLPDEGNSPDSHQGDQLAEPRWVELCEILDSSRVPATLVRKAARILDVELDEENSTLLEMAEKSRRLGQLLQQARSGARFDVFGDHGVLVTTFHGAKGLEFDIVFLVGCEDGIIPDYRARSKNEQMQERRALYVALTRAAKEVVVTGARLDEQRRRDPCRFLPPKESSIWTKATLAP